MRLRIAIVIGLLCCCLPTWAAPPTPLEEVPIDFTRLEAWQERTYAMNYMADGTGKSQRVGEMIFDCDVEDDTVRLLMTTRMYMPDGKRFIEFRVNNVYDRVSLLSPAKVQLDAVRSDGVELRSIRAVVRDGTLEVTETIGDDVKERRGAWGNGGIHDTASFYLVTMLPTEPDRRYEIKHFYEASSLPASQPQIIECRGPDETTGHEGNRWVKFLRYPADARDDAVQLWVDSDGVLQRVQLNKQNQLVLLDDEQP